MNIINDVNNVKNISLILKVKTRYERFESDATFDRVNFVFADSDNDGVINISDIFQYIVNMQIQAKKSFCWQGFGDCKPYTNIYVIGIKNTGVQEKLLSSPLNLGVPDGVVYCDSISEKVIDNIHENCLFVRRKDLCMNCLKKYGEVDK